MRVLLDTNVWIAALIARGTSSDLVEHLIHNHRILTSGWILDEISDVLSRKFEYSSSRIDRVVNFVRITSVCITLSGEPPDESDDPDDNYVLLTAKESNADVIVTGDDDLLVLESFENIKIISPDQFWKIEKTK